MEAVAEFDFTATEDAELSFRRLDVVKVLDKETDPCWFRAEKNGVEGFIPYNYVILRPCPWFVGRLTRTDAERTLRQRDKNDSNFLVRASESSPGDFSLSLIHNGVIQHLRVNRDYQYGKYFVWPRRFTSLNELVEYYKTTSVLNSTHVVLTENARFHCVQAIFDFTAGDEDEISFKQGDTIELITKKDLHWWMGRIGSRCGYFPSNYVLPSVTENRY